MSFLLDGTNDSLTGTFTSTYNAIPLTVGIFVKVTTHPAAVQAFASIGNNSGSVNDSHQLRTTGTDDQWACVSLVTAANSSSATVSSINIDGVWAGVVGKFTTSTRRDIYVQSLANTGNNTVSRILANVIQFVRFGETFAAASDFAGRIAEIAVWTSALSDADITSYLAGTPASEIDTANLIGYWPLVGNILTNDGLDAGGDLSVVGGAIFSTDHPPRFLKPGLGAVAITGLAPTIAVASSAVTRSPGLGAAVITGLAPTMDQAIRPPVGAATFAGLAPTMGKAIIPPVGTLTVTGLSATCHVATTTGLGALTLAGLAPSLSIGKTVAPGLGSVAFTGLAPVISEILTIGAGSIVVGGLAPNVVLGPILMPGLGAITATGYATTLAFNLPVPVGTVAFSGLAPSLLVNRTVSPDVGSLTATGYAPALMGSGGGGPGGLVVLGLNLSVTNFTFSPAQAELQFTGLVTEWGAGYTYSVPKGAVAVTGYAPSVADSSSNQHPTMQAPAALAITGLVPNVIQGRRVVFPFLTTTEGFVGTPGPGSTMAWATGEGNPAGSLRTITTGFLRTDDNTWTLATDWATLGVPANQVITAISLASSDSFVSQMTGGLGTIKAVTLTPTGFPSIELAPSRTMTGAEADWSTQSGAGTSGVSLPSGGSLSITLGSNIATAATGTPDVRVYQDNVNFVVTYVAAQTVQLPQAVLAVTGHAPTIVSTAAAFATPPAGALSISGAGPSLQVTTPVTGGGGGPGLLAALNLNLEPRALGPATLTITGYAPTVVRPITLGGSDDLFSERATTVSSGIVIHAGSATKTPGAGALVVTGRAPTLVQTGSRTFAMPVTALGFTFYVPTTGVNFVRDIPAGSIVVGGFAPSQPDQPLVSPPLASLAITTYEPVWFVGQVPEPAAGALALTGYAPSLQFGVAFSPAPAALAFTGYEPDAIGQKVWNGSGAPESGSATANGGGFIVRHATGALQAKQPLLFSGSGAHGHSVTATMRSGPASLHGPIHHAGPVTLIYSGPASLLARIKIKRFDHGSKRPKPHRVNRFHVTLKPNKRMKFSKPKPRRPFK